MMKDFDMGNMNPELAKMVREAMNDPDLIKGITEGLTAGGNDSEDMMNSIIESFMTEFKDNISKINSVIETSTSYDDLRDEFMLLVENFITEFSTLITILHEAWYDNSEEIDYINANATFRKYEAYIDAGFTEEQAFTLINKEKKGIDTTAVNNFVNKVTTELNNKFKN